MASELISIGKAKLKTWGLTPQVISTSSEGRVPGHATFSGMDYQLTGLGEKVTNIEAVTHPQVMGGMDSLGWLIQQHEAQSAINFIRLGANFLGSLQGLVVIRTLEYDEESIHPFTGVGRKVEVALELLHVGGGLGGTAQLAGNLFGSLVGRP